MSTAATKSKPKSSPKKLADIPEFKAARDRYDELSAELGEIKSQLVKLGKQRRSTGSTTISETERRARRKLDLPASTGSDDLDKRIDELQIDSHATRRALELQRRVVSEARVTASEEICRLAYPRFEQHARAVGEALETLAVAVDAEESFRRELLDSDISLAAGIKHAGLVNRDGFEASYHEWATANADVHKIPLREGRERV